MAHALVFVLVSDSYLRDVPLLVFHGRNHSPGPPTPRFVQLGAPPPSDSPVGRPRTAPIQTPSVCSPLRALLTFTTFLTKSPLKKKIPFPK